MQLRGDRIIQLRTEQNLNQGQLADKLGVRANQLSRYERGVMNPTLETLAQLAQVLNTTTDYLLGLSNIPRAGAEPDPQPDLTPPEIDMIDFMREYDSITQERMVAALKALRDAWERGKRS